MPDTDAASIGLSLNPVYGGGGGLRLAGTGAQEAAAASTALEQEYASSGDPHHIAYYAVGNGTTAKEDYQTAGYLQANATPQYAAANFGRRQGAFSSEGATYEVPSPSQEADQGSHAEPGYTPLSRDHVAYSSANVAAGADETDYADVRNGRQTRTARADSYISMSGGSLSYLEVGSTVT